MPVKSDTVRKPVPLDRLARSMGITDVEFARALKLGGVLIDGRREQDPERKLRPGMTVRICYGEEPPDFTFDPAWVLHEDDALIVWNKPAGMTTQGTRCFDVGHLFAFAKTYVDGYVSLHHRLDRETSGLVIMCRDRQFNKSLADQFAGRGVDKEYRAIAHGRLADPLVLDAPIGRVPEMIPARYGVNMPDSKVARTEIVPITATDQFSYIKAHPATGRTHQVRVHLVAAGHPVVGDAFYNPVEPMRNLRTLLHCHRMTITHPKTGERTTFTAPIPEDMDRFLQDHGIMVP